VAQLERLVPRYRLVVEKLAEAAEDQFRRQSVIHATNLAVLIHLGKPQVGEPLSVAWERVVAGDCERLSGLHPFNWQAQPTYFICRDLLLPYLPGKNEKEKVALVMASAPAWLVWFTSMTSLRKRWTSRLLIFRA
jgi:hypothetical protein